MSNRSRVNRMPRFTSPSLQRGAVLYVALIMLILLALIGIVGMQMTGLQERMAANYMNVNLAFQNAEADVRLRECFVEDVVNRTNNCPAGATTIEQTCSSSSDPTTWAAERAMDTPIADRSKIRNIGQCISGNTSLDMGVRPVTEDPNPVFQVTVYATNVPAPAATADAAIDTIFRP